MVILDFQIDETVLRRDREADLITTGSGALEETFFIMPVRLQVAGVDLLELPTGSPQRVWINEPGTSLLKAVQRSPEPWPWLPLPILDVATVGLAHLEDAWINEQSTYYLPGGWTLDFHKSDIAIIAHSGVNNRASQECYVNFRDAFLAFSQKVRVTLNSAVPQLRDHPYWGPWLTSLPPAK